MRPQIKELISLIESEGWRSKDGRLSSKAICGIHHYCPPNCEYPKISWYGVQFDDAYYIPFASDESRLVDQIFDQRTERDKVSYKQESELRLTSFLASRKP